MTRDWNVHSERQQHRQPVCLGRHRHHLHHHHHHHHYTSLNFRLWQTPLVQQRGDVQKSCIAACSSFVVAIGCSGSGSEDAGVGAAFAKRRSGSKQRERGSAATRHMMHVTSHTSHVITKGKPAIVITITSTQSLTACQQQLHSPPTASPQLQRRFSAARMTTTAQRQSGNAGETLAMTQANAAARVLPTPDATYRSEREWKSESTC